MTVPGRYRSPGFHDAKFSDKPVMPKRGRNDFILHGAYEARIGADGHWTTDLRGSSAWGWHVFNGTPSAMQGMQWVQFSQTLISNDKINDGAFFATDMLLTRGSWCDVGDNAGSSSLPWNPMYVTFAGYLRSLSRALQARGYIEEVVTAFTIPGNVMQGGGIDHHGNISGFVNFEIGAQGQGAKYVLDGLDYGAAAFNPEGDMGDVEMWELVQPTLYLSREVNPASPGLGRHRGGASTNSLFLVWGTRDFELENMCTGSMFNSPGLFGG
jgi:N-methylhydantoinase B/acetone carboxylase alpha subunit